MNLKKNQQSGEGESSLIGTLLFFAIAISAVYYGVKWVLQIKEERRHFHEKQVEKPAPKSMEDVGGYDITVHPIL